MCPKPGYCRITSPSWSPAFVYHCAWLGPLTRNTLRRQHGTRASMNKRACVHSIPRRCADAALPPKRHAAWACRGAERVRPHPHDQCIALPRRYGSDLVQVLTQMQDGPTSNRSNISLNGALVSCASQSPQPQHAALEAATQANVERDFAVVSVRDKGHP